MPVNSRESGHHQRNALDPNNALRQGYQPTSTSLHEFVSSPNPGYFHPRQPPQSFDTYFDYSKASSTTQSNELSQHNHIGLSGPVPASPRRSHDRGEYQSSQTQSRQNTNRQDLKPQQPADNHLPNSRPIANASSAQDREPPRAAHFDCSVCPMSYTSIRRLKNHSETHLEDGTFLGGLVLSKTAISLFACGQCTREALFDSSDDLLIHVTQRHGARAAEMCGWDRSLMVHNLLCHPRLKGYYEDFLSAEPHDTISPVWNFSPTTIAILRELQMGNFENPEALVEKALGEAQERRIVYEPQEPISAGRPSRERYSTLAYGTELPPNPITASSWNSTVGPQRGLPNAGFRPVHTSNMSRGNSNGFGGQMSPRAADHQNQFAELDFFATNGYS